jgi:hypothetical protein
LNIVSNGINGFLKAADIDKLPLPVQFLPAFRKSAHIAATGFQKTLLNGTSSFLKSLKQLGLELEDTSDFQ